MMEVVPLPSREPAPSERQTLVDYIGVAWSFRWLLALAAVVGGAVMLVNSLSGPRVYESTVTFAVMQGKVGQNAPAQGTGPASYLPMVDSLSTAAAVIQKLGLDKTYGLRPSEFLDHVMSVNEVRNTNLIRVTVVFADPVVASTIAREVADHAVQTARAVAANEAEQARERMKSQVDSAKARLDDSDIKLKTYRQQAQIEALEKDVEAALGQRGNLLDLLIAVQTEKAKLDRMEKELASRPRTDPNYQALDAAAASTRASVASLEKQKSELVDVQKIDRAVMPKLNQLYEREAEFARRQIDRDLAEKIFKDVSQEYEAASLQVVGRSAALEVIDPAVPADRPVTRHVARNGFVGAVAGFCFALAAILLWQLTLAGPLRRPSAQ